MATPLRGTHLIDLCTPGISYDRQVQSACAAFDKQMFQIMDATDDVIMIPNIMGINDSKLIDILAWQFHVDFYDPTRDLEFRKRLVQSSIVWHKTKGTYALVQEVLNTYWPGGATIEEWFQYADPWPPNYPVDSADTLVSLFRPDDVDITLDRFNLTAHGLSNSNQIRFDRNGLTLPEPIVEGPWYYVVNALINSFKISLTPNGPPIDILTTGGVAPAMVTRKALPEDNEIWLRGDGSWHDRYKFRIMIDSRIIDPQDEAAVLNLIDRYKPVTRWCEGLFRPFISECDIGATGMLLRFIYRESEAPETPVGRVHFIYLVPSDVQALGASSIERCAQHLQRWFKWKMGGKTFLLDDTAVQTYHTDHPASWYSENPNGSDSTSWFWNNALAELDEQCGGRFYQPFDSYVVFLDAEPAVGQYMGGTSGGSYSGIAVLSAQDVRGVRGVDSVYSLCRAIGGCGHELGHTFGLDHPPGGSPTALMGDGFALYPNCILLPADIALLDANPFFMANVAVQSLRGQCLFDDT